MPDTFTIILCEARDAGAEQRSLQRQLAETLPRLPGVELAVLPHLYDCAPGGPAMQFLKALPGDFAVLGWLYPRAAYWVLKANGVEGRMGATRFFAAEELETSEPSIAPGARGRTIWCLDLRAHDAKTLLAEIERIASRGAGSAPAAPPANASAARIDEATSPRWYPVVDQDRCRNCLECLNFCLFGSYGLDEAGKVFVEQPDACRDGCPACARICPAGAILFPEYDDAAIAGDGSSAAGEPVAPADPQQLAQGERRQAVARAAPPEADLLDRLVDELGGAEL